MKISFCKFKVLGLVGSVVAVWLSGCNQSPKDADQDPQGSETKGKSCHYVNPFSHSYECVEFQGNWSETDANDLCTSTVYTNTSGTWEDGPCAQNDDLQGTCTVDEGQGKESVTYYYGGPLETLESMCVGYNKGSWITWGEGPTEKDELAPEVIAAIQSDDRIEVDPECTEDACREELIAAGKWIEFRPKQTQAQAGLILYPGAGVDVRAYAPVARRIAESGFLVVLLPMAGTALVEWNKARVVVETNTQIARWFLAGHSMGGVAAAKYVYENPEAMEGLILWAAYPDTSNDLSSTSVNVLSIYGTDDGRTLVSEIEQTRVLLPDDTSYIELRGANHAQFGYYGDQEGDNPADISHAKQQELIFSATVHFMLQTLFGAGALDPAFSAGLAKTDIWCQTVQQVIANIDGDGLPLAAIGNQLYASVSDFASSNAILDPTSTPPLNVSTYVGQVGNPNAMSIPSVYQGEVWCKTKNQDIIAQTLGLTPAGDPQSCAEANQTAVEWALRQVTPQQRSEYENNAPAIQYATDAAYASGPAFLVQGQITFEESRGVYTLTSPHVFVGEDASVPESKRNVLYCKLWSPARAVAWVVEHK